MTQEPARRCIYTGVELVDGDDLLRPSREHVVPLSLGGSNGFVTDDVCAGANARAGKEIDDAAASTLPFLMLRHLHGLKGNRGVIPDVKLDGHFEGGVPARLEVSADGDIQFTTRGQSHRNGFAASFNESEEKLRFLLRQRLVQAQSRQMELVTPYGTISDEEDIEIALMVAPREEKQSFQTRISIDLNEFRIARARLYTKIAIGLGHRFLGTQWSHGHSADCLRRDLFRKRGETVPSCVRGRVMEELPSSLKTLLDLDPKRHSFAVLPGGDGAVALMALFGGELGSAIISLGNLSPTQAGSLPDQRCFLSITLDQDVGKRRVQELTLTELAASLSPGVFEDMGSIGL